MTISVIYRCSEDVSRPRNRPTWFSKINCLQNAISVFSEHDIHIIHDGKKGSLYEFIERRQRLFTSVNTIDENSNLGSLQHSLDFAMNFPDDHIIYFLEDDYIHRPNAANDILTGINAVYIHTNYVPIISLYDHPDRYYRDDNIDENKVTVIFDGNLHWRSAESTTCTWAAEASVYKKTLYPIAKSFALSDRELFRYITNENIAKLFTPIPGSSTHCHMPFMSPSVDWHNEMLSTNKFFKL